jgi:hypothetical protein
MMLSVMPSERYSASGSALSFASGRTASELSGAEEGSPPARAAAPARACAPAPDSSPDACSSSTAAVKR